MRKTKAICGVAIMAVALSLAMIGCSSGHKTTAAPSSSTAIVSATSTPQIAPLNQNANGQNPTIAGYIQQNGITQTPIHPGDPGSPTIDIPVPPGWQMAGADTPERAYSATLYTGSGAAEYTARIVAVVSKLTGNVDQQKILDLAPGELLNLPGYQPANAGSKTTFCGYPAYNLGGTWVQHGETKIIGQVTVVIPGSDGLYMLQLNADGLESQLDVVLDAGLMIDEQTTIRA
jgi:Probable lipoprotein LpqN